MQQFIGTKLVNAKPMNRSDYNVLRGWELPADEDGTDEGYLVEYVDGGTANTKDFSGYVSWSPTEVFENSYNYSLYLSFGDAVIMAKRGHKVARTGWNGSGMYAYVVPDRAEENSGPECLDVPYTYYREHWLLKTAQGDIATWSPSGSDSLANDWCVVE